MDSGRKCVKVSRFAVESVTSKEHEPSSYSVEHFERVDVEVVGQLVDFSVLCCDCVVSGKTLTASRVHRGYCNSTICCSYGDVHCNVIRARVGWVATLVSWCGVYVRFDLHCVPPECLQSCRSCWLRAKCSFLSLRRQDCTANRSKSRTLYRTNRESNLFSRIIRAYHRSGRRTRRHLAMKGRTVCRGRQNIRRSRRPWFRSRHIAR